MIAETIVKKNLSEIKELCERYEETQTDEFQITGKIEQEINRLTSYERTEGGSHEAI